MRVLQILKELEANPNLVSQKLKEITERKEELEILERIYKLNKTKILSIMSNLILPANKLIKVASELRKLLKEESLVRKELAAITYFKNGSGIDAIERGLKANSDRFLQEAANNYEQMFS